MFTSIYIILISATKKVAILSWLLVLISAALVNYTPESYHNLSSFFYILIGCGISLGAYSFGILLSRYFEEDLDFNDITDINYSITEEDIQNEIKLRIKELNDNDKKIVMGGKIKKIKEIYLSQKKIWA